MAHSFETGFFVKEPAWHQLGTVVQDAPTTQEGIILAGLDWSVLEKPLYIESEDEGEDELYPIEGYKALVRDRDLKQLGIVGQNYNVLQNESAFSFFDPLLEQPGVSLETAGSLRDGKTIWILAKVQGTEGEVVKNDPVSSNLLLYNSHDGRSAVGVTWTTTRVVCANTLAAAVAGESKKNTFKVRHTQNLHTSLQEIQALVDTSQKTFCLTMEEYQAMSRSELNEAVFKKYLERVFRKSLGGEREVEELRAYPTLMENFESGIGFDIPGVRGTVWAAYNSITQWASHDRGQGSDEIEQARTRLNSLWFGEGKTLIERAHKEALQLTKA